MTAIGLTGLYAYAIARADLELPGDTGARVLRHGALALVVKEVPLADLQVDERDLSEDGALARLVREHDAVARAAAERGPVLPLRFGTVVPDEAAAQRLLDSRREAAARRLDAIGAAREWGLKVLRTDDGQPAAAEPDRSSGAAYLAQRGAALRAGEDASRRARHVAETVDAAVERWVSDAVRRRGGGQGLLLDVAYLVPRDHETSFVGEIDQVATNLAEAGVRLELSGPWPPYSFATLEGEPDERSP
jgi:hypothetical protein